MDLMITNDFLMRFTADMPMKIILVRGKPYLQRYYMGTTSDDRDVWIHRFLSNDGEAHLHSHGFDFRTVMLHGWYVEELEEGVRVTTAADIHGDARYLEFLKRKCSTVSSDAMFTVSDSRRVSVFDWHRIADVAPETWTLMIVEPDRLPYWCFRDSHGKLTVEKSSSRFWWKEYRPRELQEPSRAAL